MNVMYSGDKNTRLGILTSALSLRCQTDRQLNIFILTASVKHGERETLGIEPSFAVWLEKTLCEKKPDTSVKLIDVSEEFLKEFPVKNKNTRFTPGCMLRLFADKAELPDKLLYLDYDVLCLKDFSELYDTDLEGIEFAGVPDHYGRFFYYPDYVNSGVLLLNMREIKRTGLLAKCRVVCATKKMLLPDQSALNEAVTSKLLLPRIYNEQKKSDSDTVFRHFTTTFKFFPIFKKITVKPWDKEKMHSVLGITEHDGIIDTALGLYNKYQGDSNEHNTDLLCG